MEQQEGNAAQQKKKRAYVAQGYEFGANAALNAPGGPPLAAAPPGAGFQQDQLSSQMGQININPQQGYGEQRLGQPGYSPQGYPTQDYQPQPAAQQLPAVYPHAQQSQPQQLQHHQQAPSQHHYMNQLIASDLISQPFDVQELEHPPPAIVLPAQASVTASPTANCPPMYVRSTLNAVPTTHSLLKKSRLPFALVIQPYTALHDAEEAIPVVSDQVISRCRRCRSYINPFVNFLDHGHRWRCNMCGLTNDVPQAFEWDAATQTSIDLRSRPELNHAVVEFVAPQEYMVRPPQPLVYLFLLDVSYAAVSNGLLATSARCILESLDRIPNAEGRARLGFIAVDSSLHYFSIPRDEVEGAETSMLVVSDLDEPFLPTPEDLIVNLVESRQNIETFLGKLQSMFQDTQIGGSCMGSALRAGHRLISAVGGKITVITASLPNVGYGKLEVREDKKLLGTGKESSLLQTGNSFYRSFAVECSKNQVSVDMFLFSGQYQDVASLSNLPRYTGGQTYYYPGWNAARAEDAIKLARELSEYLSAEIGLEAVLRVRATTGLRMSGFYGNFFNRSSDLCAFPALPRDQAYVVEVAIDEPITGRPSICLQTAVLHTNCHGERRIRVLNLALPTTENLAGLYASADASALAMYYTHRAVERAFSSSGTAVAVGGSSGLEAAREALQAKAIELLQTYRRELAGGNMGAGGGGLQLPANLRPLPVLLLALSKHVGLRRSSQVPSDLRAAALCLLSTLPLPLLIQYLYPRMYSLHDMPDMAGAPDTAAEGDGAGSIVLPPPVNLTTARLAAHGLYLIDDGTTQFLWVGREAVPALLQDVFGVDDPSAIRQGKTTLPTLDNDFSERVRAVAAKSADARTKGAGSVVSPALYVVREDGEPSLRLWAQSLFVEDRGEQSSSLQQWLGLLREKLMQ